LKFSGFSSTQSSIVVTPDLPSSDLAFGSSLSNERETLVRKRTVSEGPNDFTEYMERSKKFALANDVESSGNHPLNQPKLTLVFITCHYIQRFIVPTYAPIQVVVGAFTS